MTMHSMLKAFFVYLANVDHLKSVASEIRSLRLSTKLERIQQKTIDDL